MDQEHADWAADFALVSRLARTRINSSMMRGGTGKRRISTEGGHSGLYPVKVGSSTLSAGDDLHVETFSVHSEIRMVLSEERRGTDDLGLRSAAPAASKPPPVAISSLSSTSSGGDDDDLQKNPSSVVLSYQYSNKVSGLLGSTAFGSQREILPSIMAACS